MTVTGKTGKVWLIIQDNCTPENGSYNREFNFAKYLLRKGLSPVLFVGSKTRHSKVGVDCAGKPYVIDSGHGFPIVYINADDSSDSKIKRVRGIAKFHALIRLRAKSFVSLFGLPDVILGSSPYPLSPAVAVMLAKKLGVKSICEVRDLWPLDFEVYGVAKRGGAVVSLLYKLERWIYENCDAIITTMEGGREYIRGKGWSTDENGSLPLSKVFHINNGVDLETFDDNAEQYHFENKLLADKTRKKVLYAGSIRLKNGMRDILDIAECLKNDGIDFIVAGDGSERESLVGQAKSRGVDNVHFLGAIDKAYIPSFLRQGDVLYFHAQSQTEISQYGLSPNKLFDYLASGRPVLSDLPSNYSIIEKYNCGIDKRFQSAKACAQCLKEMLASDNNLAMWSGNSRRSAQLYSFDKLTDDLIHIIDGLKKGEI